jgi:hypothetical protein
VRDGEIIDPSGVLAREKRLSAMYYIGRQDARNRVEARPPIRPARERLAYEQGWNAGAADARRKEAERNG